MKGIIIGSIAGLTVATTGAIKDTKYEKFKLNKFLRSPIIASFWGYVVNEEKEDIPLFLLYLSCISLERLTIEIYKLYRAKRGKYKPSKFKKGEWGSRKYGFSLSN